MNENLRKAIDDLGIIERTRGADSREAVQARAQLERLYKAAQDQMKTQNPDGSTDDEDDDQNGQNQGQTGTPKPPTSGTSGYKDDAILLTQQRKK